MVSRPLSGSLSVMEDEMRYSWQPCPRHGWRYGWRRGWRDSWEYGQGPWRPAPRSRLPSVPELLPREKVGSFSMVKKWLLQLRQRKAVISASRAELDDVRHDNSPGR